MKEEILAKKKKCNALFTVAKTWKQPQCPSTDEWIKRCGICMQWNIIQP